MQALQDYSLLLPALCLMKIVVRAFPTALRHATACTMVLLLFFLKLLVLYFPQELFGSRSATAGKGGKAYRLTDISCTGRGLKM